MKILGIHILTKAGLGRKLDKAKSDTAKISDGIIRNLLAKCENLQRFIRAKGDIQKGKR